MIPVRGTSATIGRRQTTFSIHNGQKLQHMNKLISNVRQEEYKHVRRQRRYNK